MASEVWVKMPHWKKWHPAILSLSRRNWITRKCSWAAVATAETSTNPPQEERCQRCQRAGE